MSGLVPFQGKFQGVCLKSTPLSFPGLLGQSLVELSKTN
jgi:hypothetical protein